jgi:GDP/UDP-N,N'-diacetylbacillosamine 2-epimerase (hydrolysing)
MKRKICVVTGTRAEFGLLQILMQSIQDEAIFELQVIATGMHLSPEFGRTYREIERAGFTIDQKVEMLLSADTPSSVSKSMGLGMIGFSDAYARLQPDLVVLLGDRFEMLAAASAALIAGIPIAHLHGGETTEGAFDEAIRHSITKMSHLHFVAAEEYRRRVIQLGEQPDRVFLVGGLGVDVIKRMQLLSREELEASLDFKLGSRNFLVTFHPVTLEGMNSSRQFEELLAALRTMPEVSLIFTMPNADTGGRELMEMVEKFVATRTNARAFTSLGQLRYLSCLKHVDAVVGNSSSGIVEAPTMGIPTINIGDRQKGRLRAESIIDCAPDRTSILEAMTRAFSPEFQNGLGSVMNPCGTGGASEKIVRILRDHSYENLLKKTFYNLP